MVYNIKHIIKYVNIIINIFNHNINFINIYRCFFKEKTRSASLHNTSTSKTRRNSTLYKTKRGAVIHTSQYWWSIGDFADASHLPPDSLVAEIETLQKQNRLDFNVADLIYKLFKTFMLRSNTYNKQYKRCNT